MRNVEVISVEWVTNIELWKEYENMRASFKEKLAHRRSCPSVVDINGCILDLREAEF